MLEQVKLEEELSRDGVNAENLLEAKRFGLSDKRISIVAGITEEEVTKMRNSGGINAVYHFVDTCAGEFSAQTSYNFV